MTCRYPRTAASWRALGAGLWLRDLDALEWRRLPGTEGASTPFWSPDSRYVGFIVGDTLRRVDTTGGPPETVASFPTAAARIGHLESSWRHRGGELGRRIGWSAVASVPGRGRGDGGDRRSTSPRESSFTRGPRFFPTAITFCISAPARPTSRACTLVRSTSTPANQSRQRILATNVPATFANGHLILSARRHADGTTIRRSPPGAPGRSPVPVAEDVQITWYFIGMFSVSDEGVFVYRTASAPGTFQLTWVDRQGKTVGTVGPPGTDGRVVLSPDGSARSRERCSVQRAGRPLDAGPCQRPAHAFYIQ